MRFNTLENQMERQLTDMIEEEMGEQIAKEREFMNEHKEIYVPEIQPEPYNHDIDLQAQMELWHEIDPKGGM